MSEHLFDKKREYKNFPFKDNVCLDSPGISKSMFRNEKSKGPGEELLRVKPWIPYSQSMNQQGGKDLCKPIYKPFPYQDMIEIGNAGIKRPLFNQYKLLKAQDFNMLHYNSNSDLIDLPTESAKIKQTTPLLAFLNAQMAKSYIPTDNNLPCISFTIEATLNQRLI